MPRERPRSVLVLVMIATQAIVAFAWSAEPRLTLLNPPAGKAGTRLEVRVESSDRSPASVLVFDDARIKAVPSGSNGTVFTVEISGDTPTGLIDARVQGPNGLSAPRGFLVTAATCVGESDPPPLLKPGESGVGVIESAGDVDTFRFRVPKGSGFLLDCVAERLDSKLHPVLELRDEDGRLVAGRSRSHEGLDPRLRIERGGGEYTVSIRDLVRSGGPDYVYVLDLTVGSLPESPGPIVAQPGDELPGTLERIFRPSPSEPLRFFARPARFEADQYPLAVAGRTFPLAVTPSESRPKILDPRRPPGVESAARPPLDVTAACVKGEGITLPFRAARGEVLWFDAHGERIGTSADLDLAILSADGRKTLHRLGDAPNEEPSSSIDLTHSDPTGRWVAPEDGVYLARLTAGWGGDSPDFPKPYRLTIRREEPDFQILAIPGGEAAPGVCNVPAGGRARIDVVARRLRGFDGTIQVRVEGQPGGVECPEVSIGPGTDRASLVLTANSSTTPTHFFLDVIGRGEALGREIVRHARGTTLIPTAIPLPSARLTSRIGVGTIGEAPWSITAAAERTLVSQGGIVDVAVVPETAVGFKAGSAELTALGDPAERPDRPGMLGANSTKGWYSFQVPERLPPGRYSFVIQGVASLTRVTKPGMPAPPAVSVTAYSNPITIEVVPGAYDLRADPKNPTRIKRGQIIQIKYKALRRNGFIGKIHTEMTAPDGVVGLRARGVTFVGQTDTGSLQVVASDDAPLGRQPFLRLEGVGTVEDEPIHNSGCFLDIEIIE